MVKQKLVGALSVYALFALGGCGTGDSLDKALWQDAKSLRLSQGLSNHLVAFAYFSDWSREGHRGRATCVITREKSSATHRKALIHGGGGEGGYVGTYYGYQDDGTWQRLCNDPALRPGGEPVFYQRPDEFGKAYRRRYDELVARKKGVLE